MKDETVRLERSHYRASIICQYGTTVQILDCLKVTDEEIELALALERRGDLQTLMSEVTSLEATPVTTKRKESLKSVQSQVNMTYSPESSSIDVSRPSHQSSRRDSGAVIEITDTHTRKLSSTKLSFPPPLDEESLESSIGQVPRNSAVSSVSASYTITPESHYRSSRASNTPDHYPAHFNSIASVESPILAQEEFNSSKLKFHSSPEDQRHLYTSNLNSPILTPQSSQRIAFRGMEKQDMPLQTSAHARSYSMPHKDEQGSHAEDLKRAKLIRSPLSEGASNMFNHTLNPKNSTSEVSPTSLAKQFFAQTEGPSTDEMVNTPGKSMTAISEHSEDVSEGQIPDQFSPLRESEDQSAFLDSTSLDEMEGKHSIICDTVSPLETGLRPVESTRKARRTDPEPEYSELQPTSSPTSLETKAFFSQDLSMASKPTSMRLSTSTRDKIKSKEQELSEKIKRISAKAKELEIDPVRTYESIQEVIESEQHSLAASGRFDADAEFRLAYEEKLQTMKEDLKERYTEYKRMLQLADLAANRDFGESNTLRKLSMDLADPSGGDYYRHYKQYIDDLAPAESSRNVHGLLYKADTQGRRSSSRNRKREDDPSPKRHHHCCRHRHHHRHHGTKRLQSVPLQTDAAKENHTLDRGLGVKVITMREACTSPQHIFDDSRPLQERKNVKEVATSPQRHDTESCAIERKEVATSPQKQPNLLPPKHRGDSVKTHPKVSLEEIRTDVSSLHTYSMVGSEDLRKDPSTSSLGSELRTIDELPPISSRLQSDVSENSFVNTLEDEDLGATFAPAYPDLPVKSPHFNEPGKGKDAQIRPKTEVGYSQRYTPDSFVSTRTQKSRHDISSESIYTSYDRPNVCRTPESQVMASRVYDSFSKGHISRDRRSVSDVLEQLVVYACTPSRPILNSEAATPIQCSLSPKGGEFALLTQLMETSGKLHITSVKKTYTYLQQRTLHNLCSGLDIPDSYFMNREMASGQLSILFHGGSLPHLDALCANAQGFKDVYSAKPGDLIFSDNADIGDRYFYKTQLTGGEQLEGRKWRVLVSLVALGKCHHEGEAFETVARNGEAYISRVRSKDFQSVYFEQNKIYLLLYPDRAIPAYLVEYSRF